MFSEFLWKFIHCRAFLLQQLVFFSLSLSLFFKLSFGNFRFLSFQSNCKFSYSQCLGRGLRSRNGDEAATAVTLMEVKKEKNRPENDDLLAPVSPSVNLGLQIGTNSAGNRNERGSIVHRRRESLLTVGQLKELQQQVLVHKYLAAGLRVPTHLVIPIWKSIPRTLGKGSNINGTYERSSSCKRF